MSLEAFFRRATRSVDAALGRYLPRDNSRLSQAMRYMVFPGGKRIRPIVVLAVAEALGAGKRAMPSACAVELIHSYSLIHDDLPCMDNADTRRGRPSCHKKFGEATAVLAGDALLTLAFEILPDAESARVLARLAGYRGMVGGQSLDLQKDADIREIHKKKTAALFAASAELGAIASGKYRREMRSYGHSLGLLFQAVDDLLDWKEEPDKLTLPGLFGEDEALRRANSFASASRRCIIFLKKRGNILRGIVDFVLAKVTRVA